MKKILLILCLFFAGYVDAQYFLPDPLARIRNVWNSHSVPTGINQDSTWISITATTPKTYAQVQTMISNSTLNPNRVYFLTDKNIYVKAVTKRALSETALLKATNADYNNVTGNFIGVWSGTTLIKYTLLTGTFQTGEIVKDTTTKAKGELIIRVAVNVVPERTAEAISVNGTAFAVGDTMYGLTSGATGKITALYTSPILSTIATNKIISWNNVHYQNSTGSATIKHPKYDATNWTALATTDASYQIEYDPILYNFASDLIVKREDKRGNVVIDRLGSSTVRFQWGRNAVLGNNIFSFTFEGWNAIRAQDNLFVQNSGCYIGDSALFSYSVVMSRSTVIMLGASDALSADINHANLTMYGGNARHVDVHNFGDLTMYDSGCNAAEAQLRQCFIVLKGTSALTDCAIDGGSTAFQKVFDSESHANQSVKRGVFSNFDRTDTITSAATNIALSSSGMYGVYNLIVTGDTATISSLSNMPAFPVKISPVDSFAVIFANSGSLLLKSGQNDTIAKDYGWVQFETMNSVIQEYNSSISGGSLTTMNAIGGGGGGACNDNIKNGLAGASGGGVSI